MTPNHRSRATIIFLVIIFLLGSSSPAMAIFPWESKGSGTFGMKGGILGRANFVTTQDSTNTKIGASFGLFVDFPVARKVKTGISFDLFNIIALGNTGYLVDGSWTLKYVQSWPHTGIALKPSASIGVGLMPKTGYMKDTIYLTTKAWLEFHFLLSRNRAFLFEVGVFNAPNGGDSEIDVKIGPAIFVRVGYVP